MAPDRPVRVMHVVSQFAYAGMELGVAKLANFSDRSRVITSVCSSRPTGGKRPPLAEDVRLFELNRRPGNDPTFVGQLFALFRRTRPHIVHTHSWGTLCEGLLAAKAAGVPIIVHGEHGTLQLKPRHLHVQRWAWRYVTQLLSVSSRLAEQMAASVGSPPGGIRVIRNGVDVQRFAQGDQCAARRALGLSHEDFIIGTVGRLHPVKDHQNLLRAAALLIAQDVPCKLLIVGDGPLWEDLHRRAHQIGLTEIVHFLGERQQVEDILPALDVFALSSRSEGLSNTILEAMAAGLPVVATDVGGTSELVCDGRTGTLVAPQSPEALAVAMGDLARDEPRRRRMGDQARTRAQTDFSLARMVRSYEDLYLSLSEQPPRRYRLPKRLKNLGFATTRRCGLNRVSRYAGRHRLLVLTYHGILPDDCAEEPYRCRNTVSRQTFRQHLEILCTLFNPVSVPDVVAWATEGKPLPASPVLITFDDGYRNNLHVAAPELTKFGIPAMLAVTTGHVGSTELLWPQEIDERVLQWDEKLIPHPSGGSQLVSDSKPERAVLAERIRTYCKRMPEEHVRDYLGRLRVSELQLSDWQRQLYELMTWDEVQQLKDLGWSISSHTVSHAVLSQVGRQRLASELCESKGAIERRLASACPVIVYPDGGRDDVTPAVVATASSAGYKIGFTLDGQGSNPYPLTRGPFLLDRICISREVSVDTFHFRISGLGGML